MSKNNFMFTARGFHWIWVLCCSAIVMVFVCSFWHNFCVQNGVISSYQVLMKMTSFQTDASIVSAIYYIFYIDPFKSSRDKLLEPELNIHLFCLSLFSVRTHGQYIGPVYILTCLNTVNLTMLSQICQVFLSESLENNHEIQFIFRTPSFVNDSFIHIDNMTKHQYFFSIINNCGYEQNDRHYNQDLSEYEKRKYWSRYWKSLKTSIFDLDYKWDHSFYGYNDHDNNIGNTMNVDDYADTILYLDADVVVINPIINTFKQYSANNDKYNMLLYNDTHFFPWYRHANIFNSGIILFRNAKVTRQCTHEWNNIFLESIDDINLMDSNSIDHIYWDKDQISLDIALTIGYQIYKNSYFDKNLSTNGYNISRMYKNYDSISQHFWQNYQKDKLKLTSNLSCVQAIDTMNPNTVVFTKFCRLFRLYQSKSPNMSWRRFFKAMHLSIMDPQVTFVHFVGCTRRGECGDDVFKMIVNRVMKAIDMKQ